MALIYDFFSSSSSRFILISFSVISRWINLISFLSFILSFYYFLRFVGYVVTFLLYARVIMLEVYTYIYVFIFVFSVDAESWFLFGIFLYFWIWRNSWIYLVVKWVERTHLMLKKTLIALKVNNLIKISCWWMIEELEALKRSYILRLSYVGLLVIAWKITFSSI